MVIYFYLFYSKTYDVSLCTYGIFIRNWNICLIDIITDTIIDQIMFYISILFNNKCFNAFCNY